LSEDVPLSVLIGLLVFLLVVSAFVSGTETALMTLNRYRLRHKARSGHRGARLAEALLKRPDKLIGLILFTDTLANALAASMVTMVSLKLGGPIAATVATAILAIVLLIFTEVTPKTLGALHPERLAFPAAFIYYPILKVTRPLVWLVTVVSNGVLRLFGVAPEQGIAHHLTIEELRTLVAESGALLPPKRHEIMMRVLELGEITVEDIMIPNSDVVGIDLDENWERILQIVRDSGYTRLPVYRESMDNVVGVLHLKRLIQQPDADKLNRAALEKLLDEPYFVPEGTTLNKQLVQFQRTRQRTGFVVDEYGDIQGIVTLEDLLEEIVGEFTSEPDAGEPDVRKDEAHGGWTVNAGANVRVLNRMMNWQLPTDGPKTLNGLILEKLEAIPRKGTILSLNGYPIEILQTSGTVVDTVRVREPGEPRQRLAAGA
jgi:Mg2+/Co2+ transporter CorB